MRKVIDRVQEFRQIGEWDWWVFYDGTVLHAAEVQYDQRLDVGGQGSTACGRRGTLWIPGIFTRMGAQRCKRCCLVVGFPQGTGSPKNDKKCRPLVKRRLAVQVSR